MDTRRLIALLLVALGVVALLARLSGGTGWLWIGVVAISFLYAYNRERTYGLLVIGAVLAGVSAGILLEGNLGWDGGFLVGVGAGILGIELGDPAPRRWPRIVGAALIVVGLVNGLLQAGVLGSAWFALVLIGAGAWLLLRRSGDGWVHVGPPPGSEAHVDQAPQPPPAQPGPGTETPELRWVDEPRADASEGASDTPDEPDPDEDPDGRSTP